MPLAARGSTAVRGIFPLLRAQILASHSRVEGTQELAEIPRAVLDLQGRHPDLDNPRYPGAFSELAPEEFRRLGERYLAATKVYRSSGKAGALRPYFIDKMPNNFQHIGLIRLRLPNARSIDTRRKSMACRFGNLKRLLTWL
jgi:hypothetical protein